MKLLILLFTIIPILCFSQSEKFKFYLNYCNTNNLFKYKPSNIYSPENIEVQKYNHNAGFNIQYQLKNNVFIKSGVYNMKLQINTTYNVENYPKDIIGVTGYFCKEGSWLRFWSIPIIVSYRIFEKNNFTLYSSLGSNTFIKNYDSDSYTTIYLINKGNFAGYETIYATQNKSNYGKLFYLSGAIQLDYFFLKHLGISAELSYNHCVNKFNYSLEFFRIHSLEFKVGFVLK